MFSKKILFVFTFIFMFAFYSTYAFSENISEITAIDAVKEVDQNRMRFDKKYNNNQILITGTVAKIDEKNGKYLVYLNGSPDGNPFKVIECQFSPDKEQSVLNLNKGNEIKVLGTYKGKQNFELATLTIFDCSIKQ